MHSDDRENNFYNKDGNYKKQRRTSADSWLSSRTHAKWREKPQNCGNGSEKRKSGRTQQYTGDECNFPDLSGGIHHAEREAEASGSDDPHRQKDNHHVLQCVPGCTW